MRNNIITFIIFVSAMFLNACKTKTEDSKVKDSLTLETDYFGQKTPGLLPEIFAPGLVSVDGRYEGGVNFSSNLDEMYFSPTINGHSAIYFSKLENKKWSALKKANFTKGKINDEFSPFVSHSGKRIYFSTYDSIAHLKIWYVNRTDDSWSNLTLLDSPINNERVIFWSEAKNGDIFYINDSKRKMYWASNKNGQFFEGIEVGIEYGSHGFISPSQDFILVEAHKENDKTKDKDVYVYFKNKNEKWTKPINLGAPVNTKFREGSPTMTPDGKYLFFNRYNEESGNPNIYWVSAEVINSLRPNNIKNQ